MPPANSTDHKEAIELFEKIQDIFRLNEFGDLDIKELKDKLFNQHGNPQAVYYIYNKMPEFFMRNYGALRPLYTLYLGKDRGSFDNSSVLDTLGKDFSNMGQFEVDYPVLQRLATSLKDSTLSNFSYVWGDLWKDEAHPLLIKRWEEEAKKYPGVFEQISEEGCFEHDGLVYSDDGLLRKEIQEGSEDKGRLEFACRVLRARKNKAGRLDELFDPEIDKNIEYYKSGIEKEQEELAREISKLESLEKKLYFPIIMRKKKNEDLNRKKSLRDSIEQHKSEIAHQQEKLTPLEDDKEFGDTFKATYTQYVRGILQSQIANEVGENAQIANRVVNNMMENMTNGQGEFLCVVDELKPFASTRSFDIYISPIFNALDSVSRPSQRCYCF